MPPAIPGRQCHICQTIPHRASRWAPGGGSHPCKMQDDCVSGEPMAAVHKIHPRSQPHFTTKWIPVGIRRVTLGQHFVDYNPAALGWLYYMLGCPCFFTTNCMIIEQVDLLRFAKIFMKSLSLVLCTVFTAMQTKFELCHAFISVN